MSVCRNCEEKIGGYCHGCMNNTVDTLTAQLAERDAEIEEMKFAYKVARDEAAEARKQAAQEIYNSLQKCFWAVDFETVRANLKHKFGLEG